ncbi:MAG: hypothetical protein ACM3VV_07070 [Deltaproteobacteria bacterium]
MIRKIKIKTRKTHLSIEEAKKIFKEEGIISDDLVSYLIFKKEYSK